LLVFVAAETARGYDLLQEFIGPNSGFAGFWSAPIFHDSIPELRQRAAEAGLVIDERFGN
jgi:hypothetical protein